MIRSINTQFLQTIIHIDQTDKSDSNQKNPNEMRLKVASKEKKKRKTLFANHTKHSSNE